MESLLLVSTSTRDFSEDTTTSLGVAKQRISQPNNFLKTLRFQLKKSWKGLKCIIQKREQAKTKGQSSSFQRTVP